MRKTAIALTILIVVALAALYFAPKLYDFDRYRPTVAEWASKALGRPVTLAGTMSLELLPSPHIAVRDVRIANLAGARAPELARVREISAAVSFWPLLAGRIEVTSARLVQPVIVLEHVPQQGAASSAGGGTAESRNAPVPLPTASRVRIARLTIEDGTIAYRGETFGETLDHVSLAIAGGGATAPLHVEGGFSRRGIPLTVTADLGRLGSAEVPLSLVLSSQELGSIEAAGLLYDLGSATRLSAKLTLKGGDLGAVAARVGAGPLPPPLAKPFHVTGDLAASVSGATLDRIVLDVGDLHGTGSLNATPGDPLALAVKLSVDSVDLDRVLAEPAVPPGATPPAAPAATPSPRGAHGDALRFDLPAGVAASIDLGIDAVVWRQGVLRQLRVEASFGGGKLAVKRAGLLLPGGSDVVVSGELDTVAGPPRFAGTLEANTDNLRDFLRWSGIAVEGVPPDRLRRAALQSRVEVDGAVMELRSIDLGVDAAHLTGAATVALRERLAFGARLAIDQLNLDAYLAENRAPAAPARVATAPAGSAAIRIT
ncbi:MAG: AsmA family protein, partial [Acidobacteriota bacterium]